MIECKAGTSAARIVKWRSQLRNGFITAINGTPVNSIKDIQQLIKEGRKNPTLTFDIATIHQQDIHPQLGTPQLYHDQMNIIAEHLWEISNNPEWNKEVDEQIVHPIPDAIENTLHTKLRKKLKINKLSTLLKKNS